MTDNFLLVSYTHGSWVLNQRPPQKQLTSGGDSGWAGALTGKIMTDNPVE